MIMTIAELRRYVETDEPDQVLEARLHAVELLIRATTNNNFQERSFRAVAVAMEDGKRLLINTAIPFRIGDTLQITESELQDNVLVTVTAIADGTVTVAEDLYDESGVVITKVRYPADLKMGVANLIKWELSNRDKVGVQSESISRHSVTYFNMDGSNSSMGYPRSLLGFLSPYRKARFGKGLGR